MLAEPSRIDTARLLRARTRAAAIAIAAIGAPATQAQWISQATPTTDTIQRLSFVDTATGYATGSGNSLIKTGNGGRTWSSTSKPSGADFLGCWFLDAGTGWVTEAGSGKVWKTGDGGGSWTLAAWLADEVRWVAFPTSAQFGWVGGANGLLARTVDGGANWIAYDSPIAGEADNRITDGWFPVDNSIGWCVGDGGYIQKREAARMITGTYTGNGVDGRQITGLGFAPDVVIVKGDTAPGKRAYIRTSTVAGDKSKSMTGLSALQDNRIESLDADGFTVGTDLNTSAHAYSWVAWKAVAGECAVGSYVGSGIDDTSVGGVGFQPACVMVFGEIGGWLYFRTAAMPAGRSAHLARDLEADIIQDLEADGFQVGADNAANQVGKTFHYVAWKQVANKMAVGTYAGDGIDDRSVNGQGFRPEYVLVYPDDSSLEGCHRPESLPADQSLGFDSGTGSYADGIQLLEDDGFQIGTSTEVNEPGVDYYWIAWGGKWLAQASGGDWLNGVHFADEQVGCAVGEGDRVLATTDGGQTWTAKPTGTSVDYHGAWFADADTGFVAGDGGYVYRTDDGGDSWIEELSGGADLRDVMFPEDSVSGWAAGAAGDMKRTAPPLMLTGQYRGDGTDSRSITGLGFEPDVVILKGHGQVPLIRTSTMSGDATKPLHDPAAPADQQLLANAIQSLDADGFTIGDDDAVNRNNITYFWAAFPARHELAVGTYAGNGADDRSIAGLGFQPDYLIVMAEQDAPAVQRFASMTGDASSTFDDDGPIANHVQAFEADGFQVGSAAAVNAGTSTYHFVAFRDVPEQIEMGSYVGDGWDDVSITGLGMEPGYLIIKAGTAEACVQRFRSMGRRDTSLDFTTTQAFSNWVQRFEADGFEVGDATEVNAVGATYHYVAFGRDQTQPDRTPVITTWAEVDPRN